MGAIWADVGRKGTPILLPHPNEAIHSLDAYFRRESNPKVIVLPYAPVPTEVMEEVETLVELGMGISTVIESGDPHWPAMKKGRYFDGDFLQQLFTAIEQQLFEPEEVLPAEYLMQLAERCPRLIIPDGSLAFCNDVASHRYSFIKQTGDALHRLCEENGSVGPLFEFFESRGLDYARTGGMTGSLEVFSQGMLVLNQESNDHVKQGDKTTPQAAARVYFQTFDHAGKYYVAILYAGPHPDQQDITVRCSFE